MFSRIAGSRCVLPLSISLNLGYRYYARHLPAKTGPTVYRDPDYLAAARPPAADTGGTPAATATRSCGAAGEAANFVELGIL
jgi:hypothetical protein